MMQIQEIKMVKNGMAMNCQFLKFTKDILIIAIMEHLLQIREDMCFMTVLMMMIQSLNIWNSMIIVIQKKVIIHSIVLMV